MNTSYKLVTLIIIIDPKRQKGKKICIFCANKALAQLEKKFTNLVVD